jgi:hypothetical protein
MIAIVSTAGPVSEGTPEPGSAAPGEMPWVRRSAYETVETALADLDAIEQLPQGRDDRPVRRGRDRQGGRQASCRQADGPPAHPCHPEWFGGGTLPRKELHEAAEQLTADQAGLIAVGEPTIERGLDKAPTKAAKVVNRTVEATTDEITSKLQEALKR